jgi:ribonucleoside-diphosphate reductase alpha chain
MILSTKIDDVTKEALVTQRFCPVGKDPYETVTWEKRVAEIKDETGGKVFKQEGVEVPSFWSPLAVNIVASKYFYGELGTTKRENSVRQLIHRVAHAITRQGVKQGYFNEDEAKIFYNDLAYLCLHQYGAFNSPVWFNVGLFEIYGIKGAPCNWSVREDGAVVQTENPYERPQASACFIQSVGDNMESIMELAQSEAMLFKYGSGTGTDLSTLRSSREKLSGGGKPSGPLSFMRVYDQIAGVVKSGGKTRRAAKMQTLKIHHPDILEFIQCKTKEEKKALTLIAAGYEANFNGDAYSSVAFQNANLSVRLTDEFMNCLANKGIWKTQWISDKTKEGPSYPAVELMEHIAQSAWQCGDPGVQFDTTMNNWNTCANTAPINSTNPCSEFVFLDDTACNLASINLMKFLKTSECGTREEFDGEAFAKACKVFFLAQDILVDYASYPTKKIAANSHKFRPLGLGYSNLGCVIMSMGYAYDSDEGRDFCSMVTAIMHGTANLTSVRMAEVVGQFEGYQENRTPFLEVMEKHRKALGPNTVRRFTKTFEALDVLARKIWDEVLDQGKGYGFRNSQATVLAPTGTISFMMDCDTTGIEPDIALVKYKHLAGGGMLKMVNQSIPRALRVLGYSPEDVTQITKFIEQKDTIEGCPNLKQEHLSVFDCAFKARNGERSIPWLAHVKMMARAQPFISGAISKTVNMPEKSTPADIMEAYILAWQLGLKAVAIYRDNSKGSQPLNTGLADKKETVTSPVRKKLPETRDSKTHKFEIAGHEGYLTVGLYEDGTPGELFIKMSKEGSTLAGMMDAVGTSISIGLQYGVPLQVLVTKFKHTRFEPSGFTKNKKIRSASSVMDYIAKWLEETFIPKEPAGDGAELQPYAPASNGNGHGKITVKMDTSASTCDVCGSITIKQGNCDLCFTCGTSKGCS